ncbi:MAG: hypothetical protein [Olavius algarvensis Gamma 3 endosymbiont]|nr:MAG: hypothetical protein [Olavius algarvensis Gamma 3 endosymbiont]
MKPIQPKSLLSPGMLAVAVASFVMLASCGGGGGTHTAGIGGTGIVAGETTGFGSIYVNGDRYDTNTSRFVVDGDPNAGQSDLALGMFVKIKVETLDGNFTGKAIEVIYDDEVQGPVTAAPVDVPGSGGSQKTFDVFGQTVTIDETDTLFDGISFATLAANDVVEISGFRTSDTEITASYVESKGTLMVGSEVELRGIIEDYRPAFQDFTLDGVSITFDNLTEIEVPNGMLQDGLFVEVEGTHQTGPVRVAADKIEFEDEDFGDEIDDISLQGIISNFNGIGDFEINGQPIDASGASLSPGNAASLLANGVEIEVEGDIVGGVLIADELELREGESELRTTVSAIDLPGNRFQLQYPGLGTLWVNTNGQTLFKDEAGAMPVQNFSLDLLMIGDFVKVKGIAGGGEVTAEIVKRLDPDSTKLEGLVDSFFANTSITILGITYPLDPAATYEDSSGPISAATFFAALQAGIDIVELEDDEPDGDADEVEFD